MKNNFILVFLAIALSFTLLLSDNIESAYAFSLTSYNNGTTDVRAVVTKYGNSVGDITAIGDIVTDSVYLRNTHTLALLATITGVTDPAFAFVSNTANGANFVYFYGGATGNIVYEINIVDRFLVRSVTTSCSAVSDGFYVDSNAGAFYCADATELVYKYSIASLVPLTISTTLNAGATPCDGIEGLSYDSTTDTMFALCATTDNIVGVIAWSTSGTPDFSVATGAITGGQIAFNTREDNISSCQNTLAPKLYNWSASTGFTFWKDLDASTVNCQVGKYSGRMLYEFTTDRFFLQDSGGTIRIFDGTNGNSILNIATGGTGNAGMMALTGTDLLEIPQVWGAFEGAGGNSDYYNLDLEGVAFGSNGDEFVEGGNIIGGIDCSLPENENKLICRVTDPIGGAGNFVIGNGTSGLTGIGCSIGLVDCTTDTNPRTNGLGLLIFIATLFVIIGSFYYTIGRETFNIPVFIWIVIILAVSAFFTITGLIDPIFLILTAIAIVALAANRLKGMLAGSSTLGGGSTA